MGAPIPHRKWYQIQWYKDHDSARERRLINKLDLLIVPYAFLAYWIKYIDQSNLNNAYVAGMKEELGFMGNELVQLQTMYIIGAVVGQIPFMFLFTYVPMHWVIPFLDVAWGVFTLLQYRVTGFAELAAYRFLVGWFEAAFFPAMHYIFGAWYRGDEIGRRGGVFYVGLSLGTLTAGLIQAGASSRLEGVNGLSGWRWMYIICALITIPVGILGFFVLPGTPDKPNKWFLTDEDVQVARDRLERNGHRSDEKFTVKTLKKVVLSGHFWFIIITDIFFWNSSTTSTGDYLLWLKSLKRYTPARINELGSIAPALGIFYTLGICFASDLVLGPAWAITLSHTINIVGLIILTIWNVPEPALWVAYMTSYTAYAMSSVFHGWVNSQLRSSPAQRSFILVLINAVSQSTTAWTPLLVFKTVEAPRFVKGHPFALANAVLLIVCAHIMNQYLKRKEAKTADSETGSVSGGDSVGPSDVKAIYLLNVKEPQILLNGSRDAGSGWAYDGTIFRIMTAYKSYRSRKFQVVRIRPYQADIMAQPNGSNGHHGLGNNKKHILLNAFDMSTVGHLSPGQWKNPEDKSATKRKLAYWIDLAKTLERGGINALFLADTYGGYDTYQDSIDECIRRAAQWPVTDPSIPITAMAAVTKNLSFAITASTSFEPPYLLAKRLSTLDHLTDGRIGWNIVTSWKKAAFKAIGLDNPIEHDERYAQADEYLRVLYKLWEGSWADDALAPDPATDTYVEPSKVRTIHHEDKFFRLHAKHIVDPSPQRVPFLFQAGTSSAGSDFAATHAEAVFVSGYSPAALRPKIDNLRRLAAEKGRDPRSIKVFATVTPIIGRTDDEARRKHAELLRYASVPGGLVLFSGWTGIDISRIPLDQEITEADSTEAHKVRSILSTFTTPTEEVPRWTPRIVAQHAAIGGLGPVPIGSPQTVADELERWIREADIDGFNVGYVTTPGSFEDVVDLLIPELRRRGVYPELPAEGSEPLTAREKIYGEGQRRVRADHVGSKYRYDVYEEEPPYIEKGQQT
ncbi:luciferase-like domain-containing protein [Echria macrotheca]|uniref:Luciferase-like domain-containing protein n=1 Tax=Echria macrotheca TaxID=438768 RepID=A0AAJ0BL78_9PEZI|nr:luciferase-like domain-containing protein [Echria macrotheca]